MSNESKKKFVGFIGLSGIIMFITGLVVSVIFGGKAVFVASTVSIGISSFYQSVYYLSKLKK